MDPAQQPLQPADLRGTLLLRDCLGAEAAFLLVQLVKAALGSGAASVPPAPAHPAAAAAARVVLLAAAQAASHYAAVLRKVGLNCPALVEAGRLTMVEAVPGQGGLPSLRDLHQRLAAAAAGGGGDAHASSGSSGSSGVVLVVDDLTALRCLAGSEADWAAFLQACTALGQHPGCCFVGLAHADVPDDEGWLSRLEHAASLVLDVEPLESGRSADTTGRLLVTRREAAVAGAATDAAAAGGSQLAAATAGGSSSWGVPGSRRFCYKLQETGARYVAV